MINIVNKPYILGRNETTGLRCMGACHPMATLKYTDSVTSFPQIICYIVVLKVYKIVAKRYCKTKVFVQKRR